MINTIRAKDYVSVIEEYPAAGIITPGMVVTVNASLAVFKAAVDFDGPVMIAVEDVLQGKGPETDYPADEIVRCWCPTSGDQANMIASAAIVVGAKVSIAADGKIVTATTGPVIGQALTAAGAANDRVIVRIK